MIQILNNTLLLTLYYIKKLRRQFLKEGLVLDNYRVFIDD